MKLMEMFPLDEDGTLKRKQPCQTVGCGWPNWHICLDKTDPDHYKQHEIKTGARRGGSMSQAQKDRIAETQRQKWVERRAINKERDDLIIKHYTEGQLGMSAISTVTGYAYSTINKVLQRAQREGALKIRPKHNTLFRPGQ